MTRITSSLEQPTSGGVGQVKNGFLEISSKRMQAPPLPTYKVKVSDDSMMSSMSSISSTDVDNAMFMNGRKKDGSWDTMTGSRKAGRFDPITPGGTGEMKRLGISERYEKFHHISTAMKDSKKSTIPCKVECEGVLTNIGPAPAVTQIETARESNSSQGKNVPFTHSCCFTCSICNR